MSEDKLQALIDLELLFKEIESAVEVVIVEGLRDLVALRRLGFNGRVETYSKVGISDADMVEGLTVYNIILVLTDFDREGRLLNNKLSNLLERRGVKIEKRLRRVMGRLMAVLGVYTIEALDNIEIKIKHQS